MQTRKLSMALILGLGLTAGLVWLLTTGPVSPVRAASYTVTKYTDSNDGACNADCSLREAIIAANGNPGPDVITLGSGTYSLTITGSGENSCATGDLDITDTLTIVGLGPEQTVIDASGLISDRVLHIVAGVDTVVISGVTIINGDVTGGGGGIYNRDADLTLLNTVVISNHASNNGGGVYVWSGSVTLSSTQVVSNTADDSGGGVFVANGSAILNASGGLINSNSAKDGGGVYLRRGSATLSGTQVLSNTAGGAESAQGGGGVYVEQDNATLNMNGGRIAGNSVIDHYGGGVYVEQGSATLNGTQLLHNSAFWGGGAYVGGSSGTLTLVNVTLSNNAAGYSGGGLYQDDGTTVVTYTTIASNTASTSGSGIRHAGGAISVQNSIVAYNGTANCAGTLTSNGHNLDSGNTCGFGASSDITSTDPLLGPLTYDTGTWVHPLLEGSPAIDAATCIADITADQRGVARPQGPGCDIGAYERRACWARLNDSPTDYSAVQAAVDASSDPGDVVKVAGYCVGVNAYGGLTQTVYLSKTLTIRGGYTVTNWTTPDPAANPTTLDALGQGRVLYVTGGVSPTIEGLRITGGNSSGDGGGIYNHDADLTLVDTLVINNHTGSDGGGVYVDQGSVTLSGGQVISNTADYGGGVYADQGSVTLSDGQIISNTADHDGGGVYVDQGSATLSGGQIISNTARGNGGGVFILSSNVMLALSGVEIIDNAATGDGGGVYVYDGDATMSGGQIAGNTANSNGGGVFIYQGNATLDGGQIAGNLADNNGGGVFIYQGSATLGDGQIFSNTANNNGGGVCVLGSSAAFTQTGSGAIIHNTANHNGGGMFLGESGRATLSGAQVVSNTARNGGGIYNDSSGSLTVVNSTFSGNHASAGSGGGLYSSGTSLITYTTIVSNTANSGGCGIQKFDGSVFLQNSIVAHNGATNCAGTVASHGHNLEDADTCNFHTSSDLTDTDPLIGPLTYDEGTWIHPLLRGSPAINAAACISGTTTDQRGVERPVGDGCDIGAYEYDFVDVYLPLVLRAHQ